MRIFLNSDWAETDHEVDHLGHEPDGNTVAALDAALDTLAEEIRGRIHIITGSLKSSVKTSSHTRHHTWEGEIEIGGVSGGVNDPVDYAWYEQRRGGSHDFMDGAKEAGDELLGGAIESTL